jgi:transposase
MVTEEDAAKPPASGDNPKGSAPPPKPLNRAQRESAARRERRKELFEEMKRLYAEGYSITAITLKLSKSRNTVAKYLKMDAFPESKQRQEVAGPLLPYQKYLERRWQEGGHNAAQLWREIREQGFGGACSVVQISLSEWRTKLPSEEQGRRGKRRKGTIAGRAPAPRAVVWWLLGAQEKPTEEQAAFLGRLKEQCPKIELAQSLAREFLGMVQRREPAGLKRWIERAVTSGIEELKSFGEGLRRDWEAVEAGLTLEWSSGPVEGQVNRLKMLKRQMFGRAGLALLRARIVPVAKAA